MLLTYGGPGRAAAVWEPTYALHSHIARLTGNVGRRGRTGPPTSRSTSTRCERVVEGARPSVAFLCSPNNPTGMVDDEATVRSVLELVDALRRPPRRRRGLRPVRTLVGARARRRRRSPRGQPHLLQDVVDGRGEARLPRRPRPRSSPSSRRSCCPYHLDALKQAAGCLALEHAAEMDARVARLVDERERLVSRLTDLPVARVAVGGQLRAVPASTAATAPRSGASWSTDRSWCGTARRGPASTAASESPSAPRTEDDAFLAALEEILT